MDTTKVTRVEVISPDGRDYTAHQLHVVTFSLQDDGRTLKVFIQP